MAEVNRAGVEISRRAADGRAAVFASVGPSGLMLMLGQTTEEALKAAFAEQAEAIADAGADGIAIETMSDAVEAALATAAAHETGLPVVACMTFGSGEKKDRTMMGVTPEQAAERLAAAGADVIGSNCGQGIADMVDVCRRLHAATGGPIWIKANAGLPEVIDGKTVYKQTPAEFALFVPQLIEAGASLIGGCCGTTPEFIKAVAEKLKIEVQTGGTLAVTLYSIEAHGFAAFLSVFCQNLPDCAAKFHHSTVKNLKNTAKWACAFSKKVNGVAHQ